LARQNPLIGRRSVACVHDEVMKIRHVFARAPVPMDLAGCLGPGPVEESGMLFSEHRSSASAVLPSRGDFPGGPADRRCWSSGRAQRRRRRSGPRVNQSTITPTPQAISRRIQ
jgi:hypothetical protein